MHELPGPPIRKVSYDKGEMKKELIKKIWKVDYEYTFQIEEGLNYYDIKSTSRLIISDKDVITNGLIEEIRDKVYNFHIRSIDVKIMNITFVGDVI